MAMTARNLYPAMAFGMAAMSLLCLHRRERSQARLDRKLRMHLSERQIDKMVEDSFPASDPPSTY